MSASSSSTDTNGSAHDDSTAEGASSSGPSLEIDVRSLFQTLAVLARPTDSCHNRVKIQKGRATSATPTLVILPTVTISRLTPCRRRLRSSTFATRMADGITRMPRDSILYPMMRCATIGGSSIVVADADTRWKRTDWIYSTTPSDSHSTANFIERLSPKMCKTCSTWDVELASGPLSSLMSIRPLASLARI